jgi:hypothetical protein
MPTCSSIFAEIGGGARGPRPRGCLKESCEHPLLGVIQGPGALVVLLPNTYVVRRRAPSFPAPIIWPLRIPSTPPTRTSALTRSLFSAGESENDPRLAR